MSLHRASRRSPATAIASGRACLLCGRGGALKYDDLSDANYGTSGRHRMLECRTCGLLWLVPQPDPSAAYPIDYRPHVRPAAAPEPAPTGLARRLRRLRSAVLNHCAGYPADSTPIEARLARLLARCPPLRRRAALGLDELLPPFDAGGLLVDVGCGSGDYLNLMRSLGWRTLGIEPNAAAARVVREDRALDVRVGSLVEAGLGSRIASVVTLNHVLEHVADPSATLQECLRILKPGGLLIVCVPNAASLGHRLLGRDWIALDPPRHLFMFTPASLRAAVVAAGFEVERVRTRVSMAGLYWRLSVARRRGEPAQVDEASRRWHWLDLVEAGLRHVNATLGDEILIRAHTPRSAPLKALA